MLDFLPIDGISDPWLLQLYEKYIARSKAIGKDGITHAQFRSSMEAEFKIITKNIQKKTYRFTQYKEVLLSRGSLRVPRQISVPTIRDRLVIRATLEHLKHAFPETSSPPPHRFIKDIKSHLTTGGDSTQFLRMDIRDFYPSIRHDLLLAMLKKKGFDDRFLALVEQAITTPTGDSTDAPQIGVPQGLAISNILAAIYMRDFDEIARSEIFYRRYVDDILVIAPKSDILSVHVALERGLVNLALTSHPMETAGKTEILDVATGVQYLGYHIAAGKTSVREESLAKMFNNLAKVLTSVRRAKNVNRDLFRLNLKITGCILNNARRGWLMFFSQTDDVSQLSFLDRWLVRELSNISQANGFIAKTFRKAYYEIRYNLSSTAYVPNFDKYDLQAKSDVVGILTNRSKEQVDAMDVETIEREFQRAVGREITELEKDIMQAFS